MTKTLKHFLLCLILLPLSPALCQGAESVFCGTLKKFAFASPDDPPGKKSYQALMLNFGHEKTIDYQLLGERKKQTAAVRRIQIVSSDEADETSAETLFRLIGKSACLSGTALEAHTAHHVPPAILIAPRLVWKDAGPP